MSRFFLGALIFMETHRRVLGGKFGYIPKPLADDAFSMGGYCLDAPEQMPAGSVVSVQVIEGEWIDEPSMIDRETA